MTATEFVALVRFDDGEAVQLGFGASRTHMERPPQIGFRSATAWMNIPLTGDPGNRGAFMRATGRFDNSHKWRPFQFY